MNAAQFIPAFATILGVSEKEMRTVDRALSDAGLREKSSGRSYPEVTRSEAVRLLLGYCGSTKLTEAAEAAREAELARVYQGTVADLERFTGQVPFPGSEDDDFCRASFRFTPSEAVGLNLVQAISRTCGWLASPDAPGKGWYVGLRISVGGMVSFQADDPADDSNTGRRAEIYFTGALPYNGFPGVETIRVVRPHALRWIGANTQVAD